MTEFSIDGEYVVRVDYSQSLDQMIEAGKYAWANHMVIKRSSFPVTGKERSGERKIHLLYPNGKEASTDEVNQWNVKHGFHHACLEELLALGAAYPDLQMNYPIVALGSVSVIGLRQCPELFHRFKDGATSFGPESKERALLITEEQGWNIAGPWEREHRFAIIKSVHDYQF